MLDHVVISVPANRLEQVANWYLAALAPIGYAKQREYPGMAVGLGPNKDLAPFWIGVKEEAAIAATHIAFRSNDHYTVDQFYEEALKAGGKCNGKPGLRQMYHQEYYGAFVLDPMG
jgi:hypothetical protein